MKSENKNTAYDRLATQETEDEADIASSPGWDHPSSAVPSTGSRSIKHNGKAREHSSSKGYTIGLTQNCSGLWSWMIHPSARLTRNRP